MQLSRVPLSGFVGLAGLMLVGCASQDVASPPVQYQAPPPVRPSPTAPSIQRNWGDAAGDTAAGVAAPAPAPITLPQQAPPPSQAETPSPAPSVNYAWIAGRWVWGLNHYTWVSGYWDLPPKPGAHWKAGQWQPSSAGWHWAAGQWQ